MYLFICACLFVYVHVYLLWSLYPRMCACPYLLLCVCMCMEETIRHFFQPQYVDYPGPQIMCGTVAAGVVNHVV